MALDHITDHQARAVDRLAIQYKDSQSVPGLVTAAANGTQEVEDALWSLAVPATVASAVGAKLDRIGAIVGQAREGRADDLFRLWIRARMVLNRGGGRPEDLLTAFRLVSGGTQVTIDEEFPAAIVLHLGYTAGIEMPSAHELLQTARAAGVRAILDAALSPADQVFAFDPNGAGFGDVNDPQVGGTLSTYY